jgi:ABC-type polysaccharide transport system permease subunit
MGHEFENVLYRVNKLIPIYLRTRSNQSNLVNGFSYYDSFLDTFWIAINSSQDLFEASMKVLALRNELSYQNKRMAIGYSTALRMATDDIMEILKSTRKYYGVGPEILYKHDVVLK